jgi:anti-anti-sigma factor
LGLREFHANVALDGSSAAVTCTGDLDLATCDELTRAVDGVLSRHPDAVSLDLAGVGFVDSTGLRCLLRIIGQCARLRVELTVAPSDAIRRVFALARLPLPGVS